MHSHFRKDKLPLIYIIISPLQFLLLALLFTAWHSYVKRIEYLRWSVWTFAASIFVANAPSSAVSSFFSCVLLTISIVLVFESLMQRGVPDAPET